MAYSNKDLPHNYLKYPSVMFAPRDVQVQGKNYKLLDSIVYIVYMIT